MTSVMLGVAGLGLVPGAAEAQEVCLLQSVSSPSVDESAGTAVFTITMSSPICEDAVSFATADGSALAGSDYTGTSGTRNGPGDVSVPILDDTLVEGTETFTLTATMGAMSETGTATVTDDDEAATTSTTSTSTTTTTVPGIVTECAPTIELSRTALLPGETLDVTACGFGPGTPAQVFVLSDPVLLATTDAGPDGVVRATVRIPAAVATGTHSIEVRGRDRFETPRTVSAQVEIGRLTAVRSAGVRPARAGRVLASTDTELGTTARLAAMVGAAGLALALEGRRRARRA